MEQKKDLIASILLCKKYMGIPCKQADFEISFTKLEESHIKKPGFSVFPADFRIFTRFMYEVVVMVIRVLVLQHGSWHCHVLISGDLNCFK